MSQFGTTKFVFNHSSGGLVEMARREGRWDCPKCGSQNLGRHTFCVNCGSPQAQDQKFYEVAGAPDVSNDPAHQNVGPNWTCNHCSGTNRGNYTNCGRCGAPKGSSPSHSVIDYSLGNVPFKEDDVPEQPVNPIFSSPHSTATFTSNPSISTDTSLVDLLDQEYNPNTVHPYAFEDEKPKSKRKNTSSSSVTLDKQQLAWGGAILLVISAVILVGWLIFRTTEVNAQISGFEWNRTVFIDEYRTVREGDWSVPATGRYVNSYQKVHHYDRVLDHYETKSRTVQTGSESYTCGSRSTGDGYFEDITCSRPVYGQESYQEAVYRNDPVYRTWYEYDIDKWSPDRTVSTNGTNRNDPAPYWGEVTLDCANQEIIGCERENRREQLYTVIFKDDEHKTYRLQDSFEDWDAYEPAVKYTLVVNSLGIQNDPLRPENNE